jgi:hypothetical protein
LVAIVIGKNEGRKSKLSLLDHHSRIEGLLYGSSDACFSISGPGLDWIGLEGAFLVSMNAIVLDGSSR